MNTDFLDAHHRHIYDADLLFNESRLANADHLYGMATECGLKRLMIAFGMETDSSGAPIDKKKDWIHAEKVWMRYETYQSGHVQGSQYGLPSSLNPFDDWKAEQRYVHSGHFDNVRVDRHRAAAHTIHNLVKNAEMAGLI